MAGQTTLNTQNVHTSSTNSQTLPFRNYEPGASEETKETLDQPSKRNTSQAASLTTLMVHIIKTTGY